MTHQDVYSSLGSRINYAFQKVELEGEEVIINLFDKENMFNKKPAITFYMSQPKKIMRKRLMLNLAELGLSFISLPSIVKTNVEKYIKSFSESQKLTEGSLFAYFESNEDQVMMDNLFIQYGNPFETNK